MAVELSRDAQRWLARLPAVANVILTVLIGLAAANLFWLAWPAPAADVVPTVTGATGSTSEVAIDVDTIASAHLFGEQTLTDGARAAADEIINAPETRLNLVLTGIVSDSESGRSRALIENESNEQGSYSVGDAIASGVDLHAIYTNRVILDRNGRFETLTLESEKDAEAIQRVASNSVGPALAEDLSDVRTQILSNPASASEYIRLQPERQNGNLLGYRIYPGADKGLFEKAGLQPGELVTAINGQPLDNPAKSLRLLSELATANSASVTLRRDGQQRTITVNFE